MSSTLVVPGHAEPGLSLRNEPFPESFGTPGPVGAAEAPAPDQPAARPPGRVTTGARPPEPVTTPANPDLRCWVKFERDPNAAYNGEYGFDWMDWQRDPDPKNLNDEITEVMGVPISEFEYCYNEMAKDEKGKPSPEYVAVAKDPHLKRKLQGEYRRVLVYGEDYYAAWLSVRPGQEVKLRLRVEALNTDPVQEDYLTFGAHPSYQVTVNGQINEAIRLTPTAGSSAQNPQLVDVTIKCLHACEATSLKVLDENGRIVGQLNVVDNTKTYHLPVRVVYVVKGSSPQAASVSLGALQRTFAGLNLKQYLNENSLNQAQIQVDFENTNQLFEIIFDEDEWAKEGFFDKTNNWFTNRTNPLGSTVTYISDDGKKIISEHEHIMDKFLRVYSVKYEKNDRFKGMLTFISDINKNKADKEGGVSRTKPLNFRSANVFGSNKESKSTYAHELGHALGLEHCFWRDEEYKKDLDRVKKDIIESVRGVQNNIDANKKNEKTIKVNDDNIKIYKSRINEATSQINDPRNSEYYKNNPAKKEEWQQYINKQKRLLNEEKESRERTKDVIKQNEKNIESHKASKRESEDYLSNVCKKNAYKFKEKSTSNFLDYSNTKTSFYMWQWGIMQQDVSRYYGSTKKND